MNCIASIDWEPSPNDERYEYTKNFITKFGEENILIVSADIENQINELEKAVRIAKKSKC